MYSKKHPPLQVDVFFSKAAILLNPISTKLNNWVTYAFTLMAWVLQNTVP